MTTKDTLPRRILITGPSGFVGRHLLRALHAREDAPQCVALTRSLERVPAPLRDLAQWHELDLARGDLPEALGDVDAIVHLATPLDREAALPEAVRVNVDATARVLDWAERHRVAHVVHVSTTSVYAPAPDIDAVLDESSPRVEPTASPYPLTKRWAEELASAHRGRQIGHVTVLRPSTVYGEGQRAGAHLAQLADNIVAGEQVYLAGAQGHRLTPLYIDDLIAVLLWSLAHPDDETYNVAGPEHLYEADLARQLAEHFHTVLAFVDMPEQAAFSFAISSAKLDAACPERPRTPFARGVELTFPDA